MFSRFMMDQGRCWRKLRLCIRYKKCVCVGRIAMRESYAVRRSIRQRWLFNIFYGELYEEDKKKKKIMLQDWNRRE